MLGLDPGIHLLAKKMDPRVKPAGDELGRRRASTEAAATVASKPHSRRENCRREIFLFDACNENLREAGIHRNCTPDSSCPGLTRASIFLRRRWTRGSSPRVTSLDAGELRPKLPPRLLLSRTAGGRIAGAKFFCLTRVTRIFEKRAFTEIVRRIRHARA